MGVPMVPEETLLVTDLNGEVAGLRNPVTGEVMLLADANAMADFLISLKEHRRALAQAAALAQEVVRDTMDRSASWTINRPGGSVSAPSPAPSVAKDQWDGNELWKVLSELVRAGTITDEARENAVESVVEYKAKAKGVKALLSIPTVAPYVESCRIPEAEKARNVSVK